MSMRGGYQIIDLKNVPLYSGFLQDNGENHIHVKGIYYNLYHSNAKMILLSGLNMDNKPHRDYEIIPYEEDNEFKAILKKVWNTDKHMVYTYFLHIAEDDDVYITYEELDYDRVDKVFNDKSDIAIANSTVSKKVKALDEEDKTFLKLDGTRKMMGVLDMDSHGLKDAIFTGCILGSTLNGGNREITNLANPIEARSAATKAYVDKFTSGYLAPIKLSSVSAENESNTLDVIIYPHMAFINANIVSSSFTATADISNGEVSRIKAIYDSMGIPYEKVLTGTGYFTGRGGSDKAIDITINISITVKTGNYTVHIDVSSPNSQSAMSSIASYGGAIALHK